MESFQFKLSDMIFIYYEIFSDNVQSSINVSKTFDLVIVLIYLNKKIINCKFYFMMLLKYFK